MNIKPLIKPIMNHMPFLYDTFGLGTGGTTSAPYCYSVWLRHLVRAHEKGFDVPRVVAELGPGDSLGVGLAALLAGAREYYALDVIEYANVERNAKVLDNLADLFKNKIIIPDDQEYPLVYPKLTSYEFPKDIITRKILEKALAEDRMEAIKNIIKDPKKNSEPGIILKYFAPWDKHSIIKEHSVDMIIAQAVMEHVVNPRKTYEAIYAWLKPGGLFSQHIDFKSHNFTFKWNGHWAVDDWRWKLITGKREWVINRAPLSRHLEMMKQAGFEIITVETEVCEKGIKRDKLAQRFEHLSDEDMETGGAFVQARKK